RIGGGDASGERSDRRASSWRSAPRYQAREHNDQARWLCKDFGLWFGEANGKPFEQSTWLVESSNQSGHQNQTRRRDGHRRLYVSGASARIAGGRAVRCLELGRGDLRNGRRETSVRGAHIQRNS